MKLHSRQAVFLKLLVLLLAFLLKGFEPAFAEDNSLETLGFIDPSRESVVTTSRFPRPISQIAENISIITAADIARLNAHTLAEVLQTVPGIQIEQIQTPGSAAWFSINGALGTHVQVLIDGTSQINVP